MFDSELLEATEALARKLALADAGSTSDDDLRAAAVGLERIRRFVDAAESHALAELQDRGCCERDDGLSTGSWLAREAALPVGVARQRVRVATTLRRHLHGTDDALTHGRVTWDHARTMADAANPRIAEQVAEVEESLLQAADGCAFDRWRREVQGIAELIDQDGGHDPSGDVEANRLSLATTGSTTDVRGTLVGDAALVTRQALDRMADELFRRYTADAAVDPSITVPDRPTLLALALAELCRRAGAVDVDRTRPGKTEATYLVRADDPYDRATTADGTVLQDGSLRALRCSEDLRAVVVDSLGALLDLGRRVPFPPPAQRRALEARDGGCVFPGCDRPPAWCDAHHVDERARGGRTDLRRMALLCRHHHTVTHRRDWTMGVTEDQWFWWDTPSGRRIWSQRHGRRRPDPDDGPAAPESGTAPEQDRTDRPDRAPGPDMATDNSGADPPDRSP